MSVGRQRTIRLGKPHLETVLLLVGAVAFALFVFSPVLEAAALQTDDEPATTQPTSGEGENPSTSVAGDEPSSDSSNTGLIVLTAVIATVVVVLIATKARTGSSPRPAPGSIRNWRNRAEAVVQEGREVVDDTLPDDPIEGESGLTASQLGFLESRLELLLAHLSDLKMTAPSEDARNALSLSEASARQLTGLVQAERRLRLSSPSPDESMLGELAMQLSAERTALDKALHEFSQSTEGSL